MYLKIGRLGALSAIMGMVGLGFPERRIPRATGSDLGERAGGPYKRHDPHFQQKNVRRKMASKSRIYNLVRGC